MLANFSLSIFPNAEECKRPIDGNRYKRENEQKFGYGFRIVDVTPERVSQKAEKQAEINAKTTRADGKLFARDVKRAIRYLMTNEAKKVIER